ncbi:MAG: helix-turn-helix domain-containing protein, partial [Myxococcota bacterium]
MPKATFHNLPADKRARIVEAATAEFARRGYDGASLSRIVTALGIAKGSLYQYFAGKLDLFETAVQAAGQLKLSHVTGKAASDAA